jgi:phosphate transport system substrate-binding protein
MQQRSVRRLSVRHAKAFASLLAMAGLGASAVGHAQAARDYISIVGSSTVYPFATVVAEQFGRSTKYKTPKIESTGSGGGFKLFCGGVGVQYPDITNASRRMKPSEFKQCQSNGVDAIVEFTIGYDGIVIANSVNAPRLDLSLREIYLALAKRVPDPAGGKGLVANPYKKWSDIAGHLPAVDIEVLGPPPTSGTRDAFVELAMDGGCSTFESIEALDDNDKAVACGTLREDGAYIEAGENDNLIVQKLESNPDALGIFGYSYLEQNTDKLQGSLIGGVGPDFDDIADGKYPLSRPLFFYVKKAHVGTIPGMREYLQEFTSDAALGDFGYLSDKGLIPPPEADREKTAKRVDTLPPLTLEDLSGS